MTSSELRIGTRAVRSLVDELAGMYARLITDEMCRAVAAAVIKNVDESRVAKKMRSAT